MTDSRPIWVLLAVLALGAVVLTLGWIDEPPALRGLAHPEIAGMRQGGDGAARHGSILLPGWLLGCAIIGCFSAMIHFGALRRSGRERLGVLLKVVTALYLACWSWLVWAYRAGLDDSAPDLILTLPPATAIMIFVFWPVSMLFSVLFVTGFNLWVVTPEENEAFRRLVESHRGTEES